jgi:hypothetical protein
MLSTWKRHFGRQHSLALDMHVVHPAVVRVAHGHDSTRPHAKAAVGEYRVGRRQVERHHQAAPDRE